MRRDIVVPQGRLQGKALGRHAPSGAGSPVAVAEALVRLAAGLHADLIAYEQLKGLLQEQFDSALHCNAQRLGSVGEQIAQVASGIEERGAERVALTRRLIGRKAENLREILLLLPPRAHASVVGWCARLGLLARECKQLNERNCLFLTEQHQLLQRVMGKESVVYARA